MVELVLEESCDTATERPDVCATAESHHHHSSLTSSMLEPAGGRMPASSGFATALRDLPSFACSNHSLPLRPTPPAPRRRPGTLVYTASAHNNHKVTSPPNGTEEKSLEKNEKADAQLEEKERNGVDAEQQERVSDKASQERSEQIQPEDQQNSCDYPEAARNGAADPSAVSSIDKSPSPRKQSPRIIEDIVVVEASGGGSPTKMVPPLRLKKAASHRDIEVAQTSSPSADERETRINGQDEDEDSTASLNYCIVENRAEEIVSGTEIMGAERVISGSNNSAPKSIEIVIPSVPELGIKETRTDRINLSQDTSTPMKPFIVNYVLGKDVPYPTLIPVIQYPIMPPTSVKNPDPGGQQQQPIQNPAPRIPSVRPESNPLLSMPVIMDEKECQRKCEIKNQKCNDFLNRRQIMRDKFREYRAKAIEKRQKMWTTMNLLPENSSERPLLQNKIDGCDQQINEFSNFLRRLNEITCPLELDMFIKETTDLIRSLVGLKTFDRELEMAVQHDYPIVDLTGDKSSNHSNMLKRRSSAEEFKRITEEAVSGMDRQKDEPKRFSPKALTNTNANDTEETHKGYGSTISCCSEPQYNEKATPPTSRASEMPSKIASPSKDTRKQQQNGHSAIPREVEAYHESRSSSAVEIRASSPRGFAVGPTRPPSQPARSVIVESNPRPPSNQPASSTTSRGYSSFLIDELVPTNNPPSATALRPTAYPLQSLDLLGSRAPPNSPREALIAANVPGAWADGHQGHSNGSTTITDLTANGHYHQQQQQQGGDEAREDRRPLPLAAKTAPKRSVVQELSQEKEKEGRKKRRRVSDVSGHWSVAYSPAQQQPIRPQAEQTSSAGPAYQSQLQQYTYVQAPRIWSPVDMVPPNPKRSYPTEQQLVRQVDYPVMTPDKPVLIGQPEYAITVQRMHHDNVVTPEPAKGRESASSSSSSMQKSPSMRGSHRTTPKPVVEQPIKPIATHAPVEILERQLAKPHEPRIMSEQFPTLGNWVAGLVKNQIVSDNPGLKKETMSGRSTPSTEQRQFYQQGNPSLYKPSDMAAAAAAANNYAGSSAGMPMSVRWPQPPEQQTRSFQQVPFPAAPPLPRHHQSFYPSIPPTYSKFPPQMEVYQKSPILAYNSPFGYGYPLVYPRMETATAAAMVAADPQQPQQQRISSLIPLNSSPLSVADKRLHLMQLATSGHHHHQRFYAPPLEGSPRLAYPVLGRRSNSSFIHPVDYNADHFHYTKLLATQAAIAREMRETEEQKQGMKTPTTPRAEERNAGRQYKCVHPLQSPRSGSVIGSATSTPTSIYSCSNGSSSLPPPSAPPPHPPSRQQQQQHQQQQQQLRRECPTPNLGEVNRSPSGLQSLRCTNCSAPGARFECLGCETAFYCNETCQTQHWALHVIQCPKIMPRLKKVG